MKYQVTNLFQDFNIVERENFLNKKKQFDTRQAPEDVNQHLS